MGKPTPIPPIQHLSPPNSGGRRIRGVALISVLAALMLTLLLESLDQTIVGTAMPRIIGELQGFDRYAWVVTAYLLASTTMIPIVGRLSDQFGRKWFFVAGVSIFLLGSVLSGASQTMDQLIAFRALQGLGAGTGIALVFTVVGDIFPPAERPRWQGLFSSVYGFSSVVGPTLGGWLTDHGPLLNNLVTDATRWRWVFYINLPIGIVALAALLIYLPTNISERSSRGRSWAVVKRIDFFGAALVSTATICLLLGLTWGGDQTYDWSSPQVIGTLAGAFVLYVAFIIAERFAAEPVLPLDLFRNQVFSASSTLSLLQGMAFLGLVIYLPLYLQGVLGQSATNSGEIITPLTVSVVIGAALSGFLVSMLKRYQVIIILGALIVTIGVFLISHMTASTSLIEAAICMVIAGVGLGMFFPILMLSVQNALPRTRLGVGTGAVRYLGQLGSTLGVAVVGTVVNNTISSDIVTRLPASAVQRLTPDGLKFATNPQVLINPTYHDRVVRTAEGFAQKIAVARATANIPPGQRHDAVAHQTAAQAIQQTQHLLNQVFDALRLSLVVATQRGFLTIFFFCIAAFVAVFFLKDLPLAKSWEEAGTQMAKDTNREDVKMLVV